MAWTVEIDAQDDVHCAIPKIRDCSDKKSSSGLRSCVETIAGQGKFRIHVIIGLRLQRASDESNQQHARK